MLTTAERERLAQNIARSASGAADFIQRRAVGHRTGQASLFWTSRSPIGTLVCYHYTKILYLSKGAQFFDGPC